MCSTRVLLVFYLYSTCVLLVFYLCSTCILLVFYLCSTCILLVFYLYSTCVLLVFYLYSTCVLLEMCSIPDKQLISTYVIMLSCYVLCQHMLWCVMFTCVMILTFVMMCYIVITHPTTRPHTSVPHRWWNIIISLSLYVWTPCYPVTQHHTTSPLGDTDSIRNMYKQMYCTSWPHEITSAKKYPHIAWTANTKKIHL